jgi:hypothetical protein
VDTDRQEVEPAENGLPTAVSPVDHVIVGVIVGLALGAALSICGWTVVLMDGKPLWMSIPVGLVVGVLLVAVLMSGMGSDLMDLGCASVLVLIFAVLLMPVFSAAREKTMRQKARQPIQKPLRPQAR